MKKLILATILLSSTLLSQGFCGERAGNGGDVVVCPNGLELLDSYEMRGRDLDLNLAGFTLREKVEIVINRVKRVDLVRGLRLAVGAEYFLFDLEKNSYRNDDLKYIRFTTEKLSDVKDAEELTLPKDCHLEQLAVNMTKTLPEDGIYTIALNHWEKLDLDQQALTILHEAWYQTFLAESRPRTSFYVRYFNEIFASTNYKDMSLKQYLSRLDYAQSIGPDQELLPYSIMFDKQVIDLDMDPVRSSSRKLSFNVRKSKNPRTFHYDCIKEGIAKIEIQEVTIKVKSTTPLLLTVTKYLSMMFSCP